MLQATIDSPDVINAVAQKLIVEMMPDIKAMFKEYQEPDRVVSELWLRKNVFGTHEKPCSHNTFKAKYRFAPGFPVMLPENGGNEQFSTRAVYQWIADNQTRME